MILLGQPSILARTLVRPARYDLSFPSDAASFVVRYPVHAAHWQSHGNHPYCIANGHSSGFSLNLTHAREREPSHAGHGDCRQRTTTNLTRFE